MPKEPLEIVVKAEDRLVGYACGECGVLFLLQKNDKTEKDREYWKNEALAHCAKTCACGNPLGKHYRLLCDACKSKKDAEHERARFEKATKISIEDYDGPVTWENEYYTDVDALLDHCEQEGLDVPEYVWSTEPQTFQLSAESIIEQELELQEMHEDAYNLIGSTAKETLQAYLDVWCKEVNVVSYFEDCSRAVLLRPDAISATG